MEALVRRWLSWGAWHITFGHVHGLPLPNVHKITQHRMRVGRTFTLRFSRLHSYNWRLRSLLLLPLYFSPKTWVCNRTDGDHWIKANTS